MTDAELDEWHAADQPRRIRNAYDSAITVFSGEAIGKVLIDDVEWVRFRLDRAWKGRLEAEFLMKTGAKRLPLGGVAGTSCDYYFEVGKKYVVFANGKTLESMGTGACSYTSDLAHAGGTIKVLNQLVGERARED
jgi:hypothetical protein